MAHRRRRRPCRDARISGPQDPLLHRAPLVPQSGYVAPSHLLVAAAQLGIRSHSRSHRGRHRRVDIRQSDWSGAAIVGAAAGYFGGGILWAVLGVVGGDVLEVDFDLSDDKGKVHQSMLWVINRDWNFELYDIETITLTHQRSRPILLQFSGTHTTHISFADGNLMRIGRFPTEQEALDVGAAVSDFVGVQLDRAPEDRPRRGRR